MHVALCETVLSQEEITLHVCDTKEEATPSLPVRNAPQPEKWTVQVEVCHIAKGTKGRQDSH